MEEAMQAYRRAIELEPDYPLAYRNLGVLAETAHSPKQWRTTGRPSRWGMRTRSSI